MKRKKWRRAALALSACLFVLWWALGTGATLAWFTDADSVRNEFKIGLLNLDVEYKNDIVTAYTPMTSTSEVFYDEALYEPGYTQVVYLKIHNNGDVDFNYKVSVTVEDSRNDAKAVNIWGDKIYLPDYLRFGAVFAESESELQEEVINRLKSRTHADEALGTWSKNSPYEFEAGEDPHYVAPIIYMPEEVDNVANYRGADIPKVKLGITVFAQQANVSMPTD